jgi:general secretion pathway protein I
VRSAATARESAQSGFSLVEVLVAFAITSLAMLAAFQAFGESAGRLARSTEALRRTEEAAALVAGLAAEPLAVGRRSGRFRDGTPYEIRIEDAGPAPCRLVLRTALVGGSGG